MIKCKEDLINTYIENDHGELRDLYLAKCEKFGFFVDDNEYEYDMIAVMPKISCVQDIMSRDLLKGHKCLTLSDLKPRTSTEYEKVTESIFGWRDELQRGELYTKGRGAGGDFFKKITTKYELITFASCGLYRKVEKEIDWREDADSYFLKTKYLGIDCTIEEAITRSDYCDEFLELCRVALRANGEID